jgi:hypothetical protein
VHGQGKTAGAEGEERGKDESSKAGIRGLDPDVATTLDFKLATGDLGDGFGVGLMLFGEDAVGKRVGVVGFQNGNSALQEDDAVVEMLVNEVDGAAGDFDAIFEGLGLRVEAGKRGQQRRMDVEDAVGKRVNEFRREQPHVAGENDEVDGMGLKGGGDVGIVLGPGAAFRDVNGGGQAKVARGGDSRCFGNVRNHDRNLDVGQPAFANVARDGEEVGAAAGEEDS